MTPCDAKVKYLTSSDGATIYADAVGDPRKPSVIFIHGAALSAVVFDGIFDHSVYRTEFYLVRPLCGDSIEAT
jgi:pimeloyl-ACP methyl ester carboxylesterase